MPEQLGERRDYRIGALWKRVWGVVTYLFGGAVPPALTAGAAAASRSDSLNARDAVLG
jgi:hypothetical protein